MTVQQQLAVLGSLSQIPAAHLLGKNPRSFRDLPVPRNADGSYDAAKLVEWLIQSASPDADPMLAGGDSPNLERYRKAKAELAEMDAKERQGRLVDVDALAEWWSTEITAPLRRAMATLQLQFGAEAEAIIAAALQKADGAIEKRREAE
ncbi:MAG TPA: hypothetical protein VGJ15_06625 [Pirellulales bacterium]|jgi:hypothetical protein